MNDEALLLRFASLLHRFASELEAEANEANPLNQIEANGALSTGPSLHAKRAQAGRIGGRASGRVRRNEANEAKPDEAKSEAKPGVTHPPSPLGEEGGGVCDIPEAKQNEANEANLRNEAKANHPTAVLRGGTVHAPAVRPGEGPTDFSDTVPPGPELARLAAEARRGLEKLSLRLVDDDDEDDPLA